MHSWSQDLVVPVVFIKTAVLNIKSVYYKNNNNSSFFSKNAHFCTVLKVVVAGLINGSTTVAWHITTYARGITLVCSLWSDLIC